MAPLPARSFQLDTHAIGDRANREALGIYERAIEGHSEPSDLRRRIERAQHIHPDDIPLFDRLGVIASMQSIGCASDASWLSLRFGEKRAAETSYVWRSLIDSGAVVTNGTDAPVEDVAPLPGFYASVTRKMSNGEILHTEQSMTRMEALGSYSAGWYKGVPRAAGCVFGERMGAAKTRVAPTRGQHSRGALPANRPGEGDRTCCTAQRSHGERRHERVIKCIATTNWNWAE